MTDSPKIEDSNINRPWHTYQGSWENRRAELKTSFRLHRWLSALLILGVLGVAVRSQDDAATIIHALTVLVGLVFTSYGYQLGIYVFGASADQEKARGIFAKIVEKFK